MRTPAPNTQIQGNNTSGTSTGGTTPQGRGRARGAKRSRSRSMSRPRQAYGGQPSPQGNYNQGQQGFRGRRPQSRGIARGGGPAPRSATHDPAQPQPSHPATAAGQPSQRSHARPTSNDAQSQHAPVGTTNLTNTGHLNVTQRYTQVTSLNVQNSLSCTNLPFIQNSNVNKSHVSTSCTNLCISNDGEPQSQPDNSVVNLSNKILTKAQLSLLSKGLNFCPMSGSPNKGELAADIARFKRNLRLIAFFGESNGSRPSNTVTPGVNTVQSTPSPPCDHPDLRSKSPWTPL